MTSYIPTHGIAEISKRTGIPKSTLYYWAKRPDKIPIGKFAVLARAMQLTDNEILRIIRKEM